MCILVRPASSQRQGLCLSSWGPGMVHGGVGRWAIPGWEEERGFCGLGFMEGLWRTPCHACQVVCLFFWAAGAEFPPDSQKEFDLQGSRNPTLGLALTPPFRGSLLLTGLLLAHSAPGAKAKKAVRCRWDEGLVHGAHCEWHGFRGSTCGPSPLQSVSDSVFLN